jgi:Domain of unknown function (DUF4832)
MNHGRRPATPVWMGLLLACAIPFLSVAATVTRSLEYAPAPPDNPLKGFVTYPNPRVAFPHSLVWDYLPLSALMSGPTHFTWGPMEAQLDAAARQGRQFIPRFHLDFPGKEIAIPRFLIDAGVNVRRWTNTNTQPFPPQVSYTVDWEDARTRAALVQFIRALGHRYDGDPRLAFVPMGLLGTWGEWHNYPHEEWFASKTVQIEVMDAYTSAFRKTRVLARYPAGENDAAYAPNHRRAIGYHDDSFAWATLDTGRSDDSWFFQSRLRSAGQTDRWRTQPIGGEVRPEVWKCLWDDKTCAPAGQEFLRCVDSTHASWMANAGVFENDFTGIRRERALEGARRLGYEIQVTRVVLKDVEANTPLSLQLALTNHGVAPFYDEWPAEIAIAGATGPLLQTWPSGHSLTGILPCAGETLWDLTIPTKTLPAGNFILLLRVPNVLPNGRPVRFANRTQDDRFPGWLTLGEFKRKP